MLYYIISLYVMLWIEHKLTMTQQHINNTNTYMAKKWQIHRLSEGRLSTRPRPCRPGGSRCVSKRRSPKPDMILQTIHVTTICVCVCVCRKGETLENWPQPCRWGGSRCQTSRCGPGIIICSVIYIYIYVYIYIYMYI